MSRRNFILLILVLIIVLIGFFGYLYFNKPTGEIIEDTGGTNFLSRFNPFGDSNRLPQTPDSDITTETPDSNQDSFTTTPSPLIKVSDLPVAGFTIFNKERFVEVPIEPIVEQAPEPEEESESAQTEITPPETEFALALRYVDRISGNIYQTFVDKIEERRFSITEIPKIYEAVLGNEGRTVLMRYLKNDGVHIETFMSNLPPEILGGDATESNEIEGTFLPEDIKDLSLSPNSEQAFYLFNTNNMAVGTTIDLTTGNKVQVFDSAFTEWLSQWPNEKLITLTTKPSYIVPGYMYTLNPSSKTFSQALGDINGLTTLTSPSGKLVAYSNNSLALAIYNIDTKTEERLGVRTLAEKCVWGSGSDYLYCAVPNLVLGNQFPDIWYQGEVAFADQIWKIDVESGNGSIIADISSLAPNVTSIDAIKLALDQNEKYLFFVNKSDSSLWELKLK